MGFVRPIHTPGPLVTTGSLADAHAAALGQPGTSVLFGDHINFGMFSGVRTDVGIYMDDCNHWSVDWIGLWILPNQEHFNDNSSPTGNPLIARPVFNNVAS